MKILRLMALATIFTLSATLATAQQQKKKQWIDAQMQRMTLRQKIAQLFVVSCYPPRGKEYVDKVAKTIADEQIGGIIWGECSPTQCIETLNYLQAQVRIPLLVTIDAEWGVAMRLDSVVKFPQQLTLGAIRNDDLIYEMGLEVGRQCNVIGAHFNFAPVVDINNNPQNPVINMRSFGENKEKVTEKAYAYMKGMQNAGILTCLKHFPGHGDTDKDSHKELPTITHNRKRLFKVELYPFRELIKCGATGVMTAHLSVPALEKDKDVPSSQAKEVCTKLLQQRLRFKGLVVSDGLEMKAASYKRDTAKVALYSLIAGNDILEIPVNVRKSIDEIEKAVKRGEISKRYVYKKCRKILAAKYDLGLWKGFEPISPNGILEKLNTDAAKNLRGKLAEAALTLILNNNALPLSNKKIFYVEAGNSNSGAFVNNLQKYCETQTLKLGEKFSARTSDSIKQNITNSATIVVGYHCNKNKPQQNFDINDENLKFIEQLAGTHRVVFVLFGNPYAAAKIQNPEKFAAILIAYDNSDEAQTAAAKALFGKIKIDGRLPITINDKFREGWGLEK